MLHHSGQRLIRILLALVIVAVAGSAFSVPVAGAATAIELKRAAKAAAEAEVKRMQSQLAEEMSAYVSLGREMASARAEASAAESNTVKLQAELQYSQSVLADRVVRLYEGERLTVVDILLTSHSPQDFFARTRYLLMIGENDAMLVQDVARLHEEALYLQRAQDERLQRLTALTYASDDRRKQIQADIAAQQLRAKALGADLAQLIRQAQVQQQASGGAPSARFSPDTVISEANFTASTSMSAAGIQTFLNTLPGALKSYRAADHTGKVRPAAEMIAEAAVAFRVSPRVILVTLQKEQSLLEASNPSRNAYDWAMGCGKADTATYYQYLGFGKQIWFGAQKLRQNADLWQPGATLDVDGSVVHPTNPGTHAQYRYTPHFGGVTSFWMLYWRYFGDPLG
jgi:peptidoglycan hydrolase CwlO-like protein